MNNDQQALHSILPFTQDPKIHHFPVSDQNAELNPFWERVEKEKKHLYLIGKQRAWFYRIIFLGISLSFLLLFVLVYYRSSHWTFILFFENPNLPKQVIYGLCLLFSAMAFGLSLSIRSEKEALLPIMEKQQKKLKRLYARKKAELELNDFFATDLRGRKADIFLHAFSEAKEKMRESGEKTRHLLVHIVRSQNPAVREVLINQALNEFEEKLQDIVQDFQQKLQETLDA